MGELCSVSPQQGIDDDLFTAWTDQTMGKFIPAFTEAMTKAR